MANDAGKQEPPSLDAFSKRLNAARGAKAQTEAVKNESGAAWGSAMRVSTELLVGLFVGGLLGVGLDKFFGTAPWLLLLGLGLGFAAGLRNLARALDAGELSAGPHPGDQDIKESPEDRDKKERPEGRGKKAGERKTQDPPSGVEGKD